MFSPLYNAMQLCEQLHIFVGRADFDTFVCFKNTAGIINGRTTCGLEPTLPACVRGVSFMFIFFSAGQSHSAYACT